MTAEEDGRWERERREYEMRFARKHGYFPCLGVLFRFIEKELSMKTGIDHNAIGRRNRRRGNDVQREYARFNCATWGVDSEKHAVWTGRNIDGHSDNIYIDCPGAGYHIEVKGEKDLRPHAWIRQTLRDAPSGLCWCAFRRPGALQRLFDELFYVLVPVTTFTDVRARAGVEFAFVDAHAHTDRTKWLLKEWIPEVEDTFDPERHELWTILLELDKDEVEEHGWPATIAVLSGRTWAELLMRAWEQGRTTGA